MLDIKKIVEGSYKLISKSGRIISRNFEDKEVKREELKKRIDDDINTHHNHTWYEEIYNRNKDSLDDVAMFYRGHNISYREMFDNMNTFAKALKASGVGYGDEVPICMANSPEFIYLMGAASILGAKINSFGFDFDKDYLKEIINGCSSKYVFVEDNYYDSIKDVIPKDKQVVLNSLARSLDSNYSKYSKYDYNGIFIDKRNNIINNNSNVIDIDKFLDRAKLITHDITPRGGLDTEFTITYSSGTTSNRPKGIVHVNRSYITIGRCHDNDIQRSASMKKFTIQSNIPSFSNTDLASNISDTFMQGARLAVEPIFDGTGEFFLDSVLINRPTYIVGPRSHWLKAIKKINNDPRYKDTKLDFLLVPFAVGEGLDPGEEEYINKGFLKAHIGQAITKVQLPITISVAGGDCEHGGIFWRLFRKTASMAPGYLARGEECGMKAFEIADVAVLDEEGNHCKPYEVGRYVANSPCTMKGYKNDPQASRKFYIKDSNGKEWGDGCCYAYLDYKHNLHMKGRIPKDKSIPYPYFMINDVVVSDTKNILSSETVYSDGVYIVHIERQEDSKLSLLEVLSNIDKKLNDKFNDIHVVYRIHNSEGFITTHSGKRNIRLLEDEGITHAIKPIDNERYITAEEYINSLDNNKNKQFIK